MSVVIFISCIGLIVLVAALYDAAREGRKPRRVRGEQKHW